MNTVDVASCHVAVPGGMAAPSLKRRWGMRACLILVVCAFLACLVRNWVVDESMADVFQFGPFQQTMWVLVLVLTVTHVAAVLWRLMLVMNYRPTPPAGDAELPTVTVIVPAYNEGSGVLSSLTSVAASDYPPEKLQIIGVNDGSRDDTWDWMCRAGVELGSRLELVNCPVNRGKRHALDEGFRRSRGQVLVTIDSDSVITRETLRCLVSPFVREANVGAVAGNVRVWNVDSGMIPRMLDVSFCFSFDFMRASQSRVNTVMCTPGALSAYRRDLVLKVLPEWLGQTFMGQPSVIGEDRALTNFILREGAHVVFQRNAVVFTVVPTQYRALCGMFLRWARSNVRETLHMTTFAFRRFRATPASGARINLLLQWSSMLVSQLLLVPLLFQCCINPLTNGLSVVTCAMTVALIPAFFYLMRTRTLNGLWAVQFAVFWLLALSWINLYALVTPHHSGWLTRQTVTGVVPRRWARRRPAAVHPAESLVGAG